MSDLPVGWGPAAIDDLTPCERDEEREDIDCPYCGGTCLIYYPESHEDGGVVLP